jgi:hypothetical protein
MKTVVSNEVSGSRKDFFEKIISVVPGLKGYLHYTDQYSTDREIRFSLADSIIRVKKWLRNASFVLAERGEFKEVMTAEHFDTLLEGVEKKILADGNVRHTAFPNLKAKLDPSKLDEILMLDSFVYGLVEKMSDCVRILDPLNPNDVKRAFEVIENTIKSINDCISRSNNLIS